MPATPQDSAARRYRIEKYLTEGGMGAIYIGKKLGPGGFAKEVVLKQLLPEYTSRPEFRDLFFREAKISATLDHANIVHTFDLVESDQSLFIVMEYVRGADLRTIIRRARQRRRELSPAAAIHIALEILAGLGYAHTRRDATGKSLDIIHRDVSPSNIICSVQGAAKLSDFGIAKASTYSSVFYRVRGKVGYMSPEQARSQSIDHRCDLYSLSVCLYESLSGERLFVGDLNTPADEIYGIPILPASRKRAGLPQALDEVLVRALAPNVDDRYQSAGELAEALRTVAHRNGLAFSAPELAAHLRDILGEDPERWLHDEPPVPSDPRAMPAAAPDPQPPPSASSDLVGTEASSIGIVSDIPEDEPARSVLSPNAVSGTKDFDLDSMLNDEATRPGNEERPRAPGERARASEERTRTSEERTRTSEERTSEEETRTPQNRPSSAQDSGDGRVQAPSTPPAVWTRNSAPFPLATPKPARPVPALPVTRPASPRSLPGVPVLPMSLPQAAAIGRPLPRATLRHAVPPPFSPGTRVPPAPPLPAYPHGGADVRGTASPREEIEDPSPAPRPGLPSHPPAQPISFDIEDATTQEPVPVGPPPPPGAHVPPPLTFRHAPPAPYPSPTFEAPVVLHQPETIDFHDAVSGFLPEKRGGPPLWLATILILAALVGGASLARQVTASEVAALTVTAETASARAEKRAAAGEAPSETHPSETSKSTAAGGDSSPGSGSGNQGTKAAFPPKDTRQEGQGGSPPDGSNRANVAASPNPVGDAPVQKASKHRRLKRHKRSRSFP